MFNVPNMLTISRLVLVPAYMYFMQAGSLYSNMFATILFAIAAITDLLDGHIARKYQLITNFGKVMDPVADKIMVTAAMIVLVNLDRLGSWVVVLMLFRDFAVGGLRDVAAAQGTIIAAGIWGKMKTLMQVFALGFMIFYDNLTLYPFADFGIYSPNGVVPGIISIPSFAIGSILIYIALAVSLYSGFVYFKEYAKVFDKK